MLQPGVSTHCTFAPSLLWCLQGRVRPLLRSSHSHSRWRCHLQGPGCRGAPAAGHSASAEGDGAGHSGVNPQGQQVGAAAALLPALCCRRGWRQPAAACLCKFSPALCSDCFTAPTAASTTLPLPTPRQVNLRACGCRRAQKLKPWMFDMAAADGTKLHGSGMQYSDGWWKVRGEPPGAAVQ
jgi:hypothetical protein